MSRLEFFEPPEAPAKLYIPVKIQSRQINIPLTEWIIQWYLSRKVSRLGEINLTIRFPNGVERHYGSGENKPAGLVIKNGNFFRRLAMSGGVGFAESYMAGEWEARDPTNLQSLPNLMTALMGIGESLTMREPTLTAEQKANIERHRAHTNTPEQSVDNIRAHYDLGNEFFGLFLGEKMTYTSAVDPNPEEEFDLDAAQIHKFEKAADDLEIREGSKVLDIGCGWGEFDRYIAKTRGAHVTGITISEAQKEHAERRVREEGLEGLVTIMDLDYRQIYESFEQDYFDAAVTFEVLEALGAEPLPREHKTPYQVYFEKVFKVVKPGGRLLDQVIEGKDSLVNTLMRGVNFIGRYIFPGGVLPTPKELNEAAEMAGWQPIGEMNINQSYVRTLGEWRKRFWNNVNEVERYIMANHIDKNGLNPVEIEHKADVFVRLWDFYLATSQASFAHNSINDTQRLRLKLA